MNVVVMSPNWLGDAVMALPALADVRRHFAGARMTVAARGAVASLFPMVPGVDAVVTLPGRGGRRAFRTWRDDVAALAAGGFDLALLMPNSFASAFVVRQARIAERWGLATDLRGWLLTRSAPKPRDAGHQATYYQRLVAAFGIANGPQYAPVAVPPGTEPLPLPARYVVLAPGAAYGTAKQWLPSRFAELASLVIGDGRAVVLVGSGADAPVCGEIARAAGPAAIDLSGRTTLVQLAAVLARSQVVVSNDSGAMHLAGAVGARVVAVFGATNEHRTSPLAPGPDAAPARIVATDVWCRPCMRRECPIDHRCMSGVSARMVYEAMGAFRA